ncbi:hypothetical protein [Yersinia phage MHG19]|nr:hypothetical protein [Yersinia phage MHG19]
MLNFNEFLAESQEINEATIADVKAAAKSGKYSYKDTSDESRFQFARDMRAEGFKGNEVSNAWKSMVVSGEILKLKATNPPKPAAPKKAPLTDAEVKAYAKAYADLKAAYLKASELGTNLNAKLRGSVPAGEKIHIRDTPELYATLKGLEFTVYSKDFDKRIDQILGYVHDVTSNYKKVAF